MPQVSEGEAMGNRNADDVETAIRHRVPEPQHVNLRSPYSPGNLHRIDSFQRVLHRSGGPCFHLDKHKKGPPPGDYVDFTGWATEVSLEDMVAFHAEVPYRESFAPLAGFNVMGF